MIKPVPETATARVEPLPAPTAPALPPGHSTSPTAHVPRLRRHVQAVHHDQRRWLWLAAALIAMAMLGAGVAVAVLVRQGAVSKPTAPRGPAEASEPAVLRATPCPGYGQKHAAEEPGPRRVDDCLPR